MQETIAKHIFEIGAKQRNPSLFSQYERLKEQEWLDTHQLAELQLSNAQQFLEYASRHSPYYRNLFKRIGFKPSRLTSLSELSAIPETDKETLIRDNKSIHSQDRYSKCYLAETSGTSGTSLSFMRNEEWDSLNRAALMRAYDWYGVKPWQRNGYLWGYNLSKTQSLKVKVLDALQNRFRLFSYNFDEIKAFAEKLLGAQFIGGYSSMIYKIAKTINEYELPAHQLKLVKGTSEMILDVYHEETKKAFGATVRSEYGAAESGLIAFECPEGSLHMNIENLVVETNTKGEVLVTNFASRSFPIIRYNLGDSLAFSETPCVCGRAHPVIDDILGRTGQNVYGATKTFPALTFYYVFKNLALEHDILLNYKATQDEPGAATVLIEGRRNAIHEDKVRHQLTKYFNNDITFAISYVDRFSDRLKKSQYFESNVSRDVRS